MSSSPHHTILHATRAAASESHGKPATRHAFEVLGAAVASQGNHVSGWEAEYHRLMRPTRTKRAGAGASAANRTAKKKGRAHPKKKHHGGRKKARSPKQIAATKRMLAAAKRKRGGHPKKKHGGGKKRPATRKAAKKRAKRK